MKLVGKHYFTLDNNRRRITTNFIAKINMKTTKIDTNEVGQVKWFSKKEIEKMFKEKVRFHPGCEFFLNEYIVKMSL